MAVDSAWVRAAPPGTPVLAGYLEVTNSGNSPVEISDVSSPRFERAEMHKSMINADGMATMKPVAAIMLAPNETVTFGPGGYHIMLFSPGQPLAPGDRVKLVLHCARSDITRSVAAEVRSMIPMQHG